MISGNMVGSYSQMGKTFILTDSDGNEITGVVVGQETIFTAGDNDVREGMVYASDEGVSTGTKNIPAYRTSAGIELISPSSSYSIPLSEYNCYDYTVFQCLVSLLEYDNIQNSVNTNIISINNGVYTVNSTDKLSEVSKNADTKSIELNITNDTENFYVLRYFTYREEE